MSDLEQLVIIVGAVVAVGVVSIGVAVGFYLLLR